MAESKTEQHYGQTVHIYPCDRCGDENGSIRITKNLKTKFEKCTIANVCEKCMEEIETLIMGN